MKSRIFICLLMTILVTSMTGCQPQSTTAAQPTAVVASPTLAAAQPVNLTLWMLGSTDQTTFLKKWIPVFEGKNPGVKVDYKVLDWTSGATQLLTAFAGGVGPDVFMLYSSSIPQFADNGAYAPLDTYFNKSDFSPISMNLATWKGHLYAIPLDLHLHTFYVRSDYLTEAGITKAPETWDELVTAAKAMTKYDNAGNITRSGLWIIVNHPYKTIAQWQDLFMSAGGKFFSADVCTSTFNSQAGVDAAQLISDLLNVDKVDTAGAITVDATDFAQGKVAMEFSNLATRGVPQTFPDFVKQIQILPIPHQGNNIGLGQTGGNYIGVSGKTKNTSQAVALVKYLTTDNGPLYDYSLVEGGAIAYTPAMTDAYFAMDPFVQRWVTLQDKNGGAIPKTPQWNQIATEITTALDKIYVNKADAKTALDAAAKNVDALLKQYGCAEN